MLVQADPRGEWKVGTYSDEHQSTACVVDVEVVLDHPTLGQLQMPAVILLIPVSDQNPRRLASSQDGDDFIGLGTLEVGVHEVVTATLGRLQNRRVPLLGTVGHPVLVLVGNFVEKIACHPLSLPVGIEEADDAFGLLKRLDQSIQKQPVETTVGEPNAMLVMREFPASVRAAR